MRPSAPFVIVLGSIATACAPVGIDDPAAAGEEDLASQLSGLGGSLGYISFANCDGAWQEMQLVLDAGITATGTIPAGARQVELRVAQVTDPGREGADAPVRVSAQDADGRPIDLSQPVDVGARPVTVRLYAPETKASRTVRYRCAGGPSWHHAETGLRKALEGIYARTDDDVWVVGHDDTILHWDGEVWSRLPAPFSGQHRLYDVWGADDGSAWTAGSGYAVARYDGFRWTVLGEQLENGVELGYRQIFGSSGNDVWLLGEDGKTVAHYRGAARVDEPLGASPVAHLDCGLAPSPDQPLFLGTPSQMRDVDGRWVIVPLADPLGIYHGERFKACVRSGDLDGLAVTDDDVLFVGTGALWRTVGKLPHGTGVNAIGSLGANEAWLGTTWDRVAISDGTKTTYRPVPYQMAKALDLIDHAIADVSVSPTGTVWMTGAAGAVLFYR